MAPSTTLPRVQRFARPGVVLTVSSEEVDVRWSALWRRLMHRPRWVHLSRRQLTEARALAWGGALLLTTQDGHTLTVALGEHAPAAAAALAAGAQVL